MRRGALRVCLVVAVASLALPGPVKDAAGNESAQSAPVAFTVPFIPPP
jgi:hypothetical protein